MNKLNVKILIFSFLSFFLLFSCKRDLESSGEYKKGDLTIAIDPSFKEVADALTQVYQAMYPQVHITLKSEVEDLAIADLVNGKISIAMVSRDLTPQEAEILLNKTKIHYVPSQIALDATIFITAKDSPIDRLTFSEIKTGVLDPKGKFIFDDGNSSNFNTLMKELKTVFPKGQKLNAQKGADKVIDFVKENASYVGIIGLDVLSDDGDPKVQKLIKEVKILSVVNAENKSVMPTVPNIRTGRYPFIKRIYLLNCESGFLRGSAFVRFTGSQQGQLIIGRSGLQPYFLYPRNVEIITK
jgi:phosphate transport system substrate-binding protein